LLNFRGKDELKKIERWQKIAEMASKQSGRDIIPKIENIANIKDISNEVSNFDLVLLAYENEKENTLKLELKKIKNTKENLKLAIIIGPEGGIDETEVEVLKQAGAKVISLGKRILRTETVALSMASIIMYELEL
jgi:16S rRNA (uracil1498-N3)-methyltransferase